MFFILSKLLDFLLSPVVWITLLFLAGLILKNAILRKRLIYSGIILLLLFSNPFLASEAFRAWEGEPRALSSVGTYDIGIVLTGVAFNRSSAPDRVFFSKGADRVLHAVQLYKAGKIKRLLISGGSGSLFKKELNEAPRLKQVMLYCGVPDSVIAIESKSRNTRENALYTKVLVDSLYLGNRMLLITSAFHMPRSLGCFRKNGLEVEGYGVDYYIGDRSFSPNALIPDSYAIYLWDILVHELAGNVVYGLLGYI